MSVADGQERPRRNRQLSVDATATVTINVTDVNEPPPAPAAPTVAENSGAPKYKLDVSWTAPSTTGKPEITDYDVQYRKSGASNWTSHSFTGTGTSTTLASTNLTPNTTYEVQGSRRQRRRQRRLVGLRVEENRGQQGSGNPGHGHSQHRRKLRGRIPPSATP